LPAEKLGLDTSEFLRLFHTNDRAIVHGPWPSPRWHRLPTYRKCPQFSVSCVLTGFAQQTVDATLALQIKSAFEIKLLERANRARRGTAARRAPQRLRTQYEPEADPSPWALARSPAVPLWLIWRFHAC
jgi:hypothetical protein